MNSKKKKSGAFYNCFVLILRIKKDDTFNEVHMKVFNTGKLEIPGIKDDDILHKSINLLIAFLTSVISTAS